MLPLPPSRLPLCAEAQTSVSSKGGANLPPPGLAPWAANAGSSCTGSEFHLSRLGRENPSLTSHPLLVFITKHPSGLWHALQAALLFPGWDGGQLPGLQAAWENTSGLQFFLKALKSEWPPPFPPSRLPSLSLTTSIPPLLFFSSSLE